MAFVKMSELVGKQFKVKDVPGYQYKLWEAENRQMLTSPTPVQGYRKSWELETDQGILGVSASQMGALLEGVAKDGKSDITGRSFNVKSNGKTGQEIRYFLDPAPDAPAAAQTPDNTSSPVYRPTQATQPTTEQPPLPEPKGEEIDIDNIPF